MMVIFKNSDYFFKYHCLRSLFFGVAILELALYIFALIYEMYLIYFTDDFVNMVSTAYVGYMLIIALTAVPQIVFTIFAESTHAMDPNPPTHHHAAPPTLMMVGGKPLLVQKSYS